LPRRSAKREGGWPNPLPNAEFKRILLEASGVAVGLLERGFTFRFPAGVTAQHGLIRRVDGRRVAVASDGSRGT